MAASNHCDLGRNIELRIVVSNGALPLAARDRGIADRETRCQRSELLLGYSTVVRRRPAFFCHIESRVDRGPQVLEPADTGVDICNCVGSDLVVVPDSQTLTLTIFSATILAQSGTERILRQAPQLPEGKPSEQGAFAAYCLVHTRHVFVDVSAGAGGLDEIVGSRRAVWEWN